MTTLTHCPPLARWHGDIQGCGGTRLVDDGQGCTDCLDCGLWFINEIETGVCPLHGTVVSDGTQCTQCKEQGLL